MMKSGSISKIFGSGIKMFTVLVDPDKYTDDSLLDLAAMAGRSRVDCFFVGGSLLTTGRFETTVSLLKSVSSIPVVIFSGNLLQFSAKADAILFLSLISGRNAELLIGQHVIAAPSIRESGLEVLPTGYILVGNEKSTTAHYISNTNPVPSDKGDIAACTAMAGEMLGLKFIYLDGGSGANNPISANMITAVKKTIGVPLIVGGGITSASQARLIWDAGADMIVVGNALESRPELITEISAELQAVGR